MTSHIPSKNMDDAKDEDTEDAGGGGGDIKAPPIHAWYLVDDQSKKLRLPRTMLFLGRDECDIIIQSGTVDKRHAVITFDLYLSRFKVKDLSTTNGTYVNESRIPEQEYVTLNHMDTIRLGYDSKVYHMEQGEPCGDSPPPPPLPQQPPPPLLPEADSGHDTEDVREGLAWVTRRADRMAECQGCIAEQRIEHTCTHAHHQKHHGKHISMDMDPHQFVDVQRNTDSHCAHQQEQGPTPSPDPPPDTAAAGSEPQKKLGRNTWPRKKVRQVAHVASLFDRDGDDQDDDGSDLGPIMVESGSNYFVSADDSVCDGGRLAEEYSLSRMGNVQRIPRNSKMPLPPELETVKKGTPLYGQPAWWGEDTEENSEGAMEANSGEQKSPRPSSLIVEADASKPHHHHHRHRDAKAVYMEIPHQSTTPERDKPPSGRDKSTPARSLTSSLSKDSLVLSPDSVREKSVDKDSESGKPETSSNPALSFTVEFGDEKKPKLKSGASLSHFVPPKLRNSLASHARAEKGPSKAKESDGSCKNGEERELSPGQQKRSEDPELVSKGKSARRSSNQAVGVSSLRTADFASDSTPASSRVKDSRRDGDKKREADKKTDKKTSRAQEARKSSPSTSTTKASKPKPQPPAAVIAASVQATQYSDPTAYLIDRMFAGTTGASIDSPRLDSSEREGSDSPAAPEHAMYKEARDYDRASQRGSSTYRASGKPPVQKQKSLSKSPANNRKSPASSPKSPGVVSPRTPPGKARTPPSKGASKTPERHLQPAAEKGAGEVMTGSSPPSLTVAPSPLGGGDQEDKVSEAGTYTIEAEEDGTEEQEARQQIDEVFGVDVASFPFERPVIGSLEQMASWEDDEEGEKTLHDDESVDPGCRTPCEEDDEQAVFDDDEESIMSEGCSELTTPSWINQLNALTSGSRQSPTTPKDASRQESAERPLDEMSKKPPQNSVSRKRPGTGRKLPSIPTANDQSPVSSEHSSRLLDNSVDSPGKALNGAPSSRLDNGQDSVHDDSPSRSVTFSPIVSSNVDIVGKSRLDSPCGSEDSTTNTNNGSRAKGASVCSRGSIDTELLLRDTETVMAAMEARMGFRSDDREEDECGSDTDLSSTVAMVNGDDDYVKPTKYHSPRDKMTGKSKSSKDKDNSNICIASTTSSTRKSLVRSFSEQKPTMKGDRSPRSATGVSVVSDVLSRTDSLDRSFHSDLSEEGSDRAEGSFSRTGSKGKGTITMTKPNRAFALRRARADGEVTDTARSRTTAASSASSTSSRRSSSIHSTSRTGLTDRTGTGRSEASLGAQIAKKARDNTAASRTRDGSMTRTDGARRNSLRSSDRRSSASSSASSTLSAKKERDIHTLKSQLKSSPGQKDLAVTGVTGISSRSQSQPGSRSNSPKAAERMAWKRRKEYDPRKAVAEAKANKAREPRPKPKVQSSSLYKQRMTRSASFTNSVELSGRIRHDTYNVDSTSSIEDLSSAATGAGAYGESRYQRAFIPFHNPLRSDRLAHSADEDEAGTFPTSRDSVSNLSSKPPSHPVSLALHKSAFTPPLSKLQTPSPDSPSPQTSLLLRRRTLGTADYDESGASTGASSHRTQADSYGTLVTSPQSYDSLIVSSIYQLSLKLKTTMDKTLDKLREQDRVSITPSPIDDFLGHPTKSEIPAWKSANQELAGVLKNLRKMEHHLHMMDRALFPDEDTDTDVSGMSISEKHKYFQEIERIRNELAGFQPIDGPRTESQDPGSPEMAELAKSIR